jgi:hypothetical protein
MFLLVLLVVCLGAGGICTAQGKARPSYPSGFVPGTRVVLLADTPVVGDGLTAGMAGTIICCDANDCSGSLLVSWDLWTAGADEQSRCVTTPVGSYPAGSATWVDPRSVLLGRPFDKIGILRESEVGCLDLETADGKLFHLVLGPEFRKQWPIVMPGNGVRVRGLLNTSAPDPAAPRTCPVRDGDIYHPILADYNWTGESCCDPFVCGFLYGDRVVLIGEDDPNGAMDLPRGTSGTIIGCNSKMENSVLVSWNLWTHGGDPNAYLASNERLTGLFPPGSTWWVPVQDLAKWFRTDCGSLQEVQLCSNGECPELAGMGLFVKTHGLYYLPDLETETPLPGGQFRASGLLAPYATLPQGVVTSAAGVEKEPGEVLLHSVLIACPPTGCSQPSYAAGDRVRLLVNEPGGAQGLSIDATGTVVCTNSSDPNTPVFVSWDYWTGGDDNQQDCDCCERPLWYPETSGWWMACTEIEPIVLPDLYDVGESHRGFTPTSLVAGQAGQTLTIAGLIGNRGGQQSGSFLVEIFASTDTEITQDDYLIGVVGMDIDAGGSADIAWAGDFPTDIPAGTYHIGWLIDPENLVQEARENNNTAVVEAKQLIVTAP